MAVKKERILADEESQKFSSKYLSNTVNDMINNLAKVNKLAPNSYKLLAEDNEKLEYIPFGIPELDHGLRGGLLRGTVVEIYGPPGGGKSYLGCYKAVASVTQNFGNVWIYDIENAFSRERAEDLGVATNRIVIDNKYETGEQVLNAICEQIYNTEAAEKNEMQVRWADLIVLDSIAGLGSRNELESDIVGEIANSDEKMGIKKKPASKAMMISDFQTKLNKAIKNGSGIWTETMPGTFMPDNSFYSFLPEDDEIPDDILEEIKKTVKVRQTVLDVNHPDLWKAVYYAQERRDRLDEYIEDLAKIIGETAADDFKKVIESKNSPKYIEARKALRTNPNEQNKVELEKLLLKLNNIASDLLKGKKILPPTSAIVKDFERITNGYIYKEPSEEGLSVVHYNPGPTVIIINQVRVTGIGSWTGTSLERPGGFALKHCAGTALNVTPITNKTRGEVLSSDGKDLAGWKSNVYIEKARFAAPKSNYEITIPFTNVKIDDFDSFMSDCQKLGLWDFLRKSYVLPKDGSIIKTKDELEWKQQLLDVGLEYLQKQLSYSDEVMIPVYEALKIQLAEAALAVIEDEEEFGEVQDSEY